jgi:hypothetical protein
MQNYLQYAPTATAEVASDRAMIGNIFGDAGHRST